MAKKPYTKSDVELLLARLVKYLGGSDEPEIAERLNLLSVDARRAAARAGVRVTVPPAREGRAIFGALLRANLGNFEIGKSARDEVAAWDDARVHECRALFEGLLLLQLPPGGEGAIGGFQASTFFGIAKRGARVVMTVDGAAVDVLTFQIINLLQAASVERLQYCDCGRLFFRIGRQEFCSERCQNRSYMRRRRQTEKAGARGKAART